MQLSKFYFFLLPRAATRNRRRGVTASQNRETTRRGWFESKNTNDPANPARVSAEFSILNRWPSTSYRRINDAGRRGGNSGKHWRRNNDDDASARLLINFRLIKRNGARYEARRRSREFGRKAKEKKVGGGESVASERASDRSIDRERLGSAPPRREPSVRQTHASHTAKGSKPGGGMRGWGEREARRKIGGRRRKMERRLRGRERERERVRGPVGDKAIKRNGGERERETKRGRG